MMERDIPVVRSLLPRPHPPRRTLAIALMLTALLGSRAGAGTHASSEARSGLDIAAAAAQSWAGDASLIYIENDEDLQSGGTAPRWGYLFFSPALEKARVYSVRDGKIVVAENLEMKFEAPPLTAGWIDSGAALDAADEKAGRAFCREHGGKLSTMLLMRGAFSEGDPDQTTWTLIYTSPHAASLFVVVDASAGKVRRTWRG
jgi:hypothetical protein